MVSNKLYLPNIDRTTKRDVLLQMCTVAAEAVGNSPERFFRLVWEREEISPSGWQDGLAVPHARVDGLLAADRGDRQTTPPGVDFDSRDGKPARFVILILTEDNQSQNDLLRDAGELFTRNDATAARAERRQLRGGYRSPERSRRITPYINTVTAYSVRLREPRARAARI